MRRLERGLVMVLLTIVALTGCANRSATVGPSRSTPNTVPAGQQPLGWYLATASETRTILQNASASIVSQCLHEHGYEIAVPRQLMPHGDAQSTRLGLGSLEQARRFGYSDPMAVEAAGYEAPSYPENDPQFDAVLGQASGSPVPVTSPVDGSAIGSVFKSGGCNAEALEALYGSFDAYVAYSSLDIWIQTKAADALARAKAHPQVLAADQRWATCMSEAGYSFTNPDEAAQFDWQDVDRARAAAVTDFGCREESGYLHELTAADAAAQREVIDVYPDIETRYRQLLDPVLAAASRITAP